MKRSASDPETDQPDFAFVRTKVPDGVNHVIGVAGHEPGLAKGPADQLANDWLLPNEQDVGSPGRQH